MEKHRSKERCFFWQAKTMFSPCGDGFCFGKIHGRSLIAPRRLTYNAGPHVFYSTYNKHNVRQSGRGPCPLPAKKEPHILCGSKKP